jgi:hypothetical protein
VGNAAPASGVGGSGGAGVQSTLITGAFYGGGGGGGAISQGGAGVHGGGDGATNAGSGGPATYFGGGGGGDRFQGLGGGGYQGIVYIRFNAGAAIGSGGVVDVTSGWQTHYFTASGWFSFRPAAAGFWLGMD